MLGAFMFSFYFSIPMTEEIHPITIHPHSQRLGYLDAVRGIAALWVLIFHFITFRFREHSAAKLVGFIFNGEAAIFLFVLSGFALSFKHIVLRHPLDMKAFYVNRFLRLWPTFFVAVILTALYHYRSHLGIHYLADQFLLNKTHFWEEALLIRANPHHQADPLYVLPGWALVIMLAMSFFIPFIIALAIQDSKYLVWMLLALLLMGNTLGPYFVYFNHFVLGVLAACLFQQVSNGGLKNSKWYKYRYLIFCIAILLFSARQFNTINKIHFFGAWYNYWIKDYLGFSFSYYSALASFVFLIGIIHSATVKKFLDNRVLRFLGKLSYCIYLIHWVVVTAIFQHWHRIVPLFPNIATAVFVSLIACVAVTLALAVPMYHFVELPAARLSKKITNRLSPSFVIQ